MSLPHSIREKIAKVSYYILILLSVSFFLWIVIYVPYSVVLQSLSSSEWRSFGEYSPPEAFRVIFNFKLHENSMFRADIEVLNVKFPQVFKNPETSKICLDKILIYQNATASDQLEVFSLESEYDFNDVCISPEESTVTEPYMIGAGLKNVQDIEFQGGLLDHTDSNDLVDTIFGSKIYKNPFNNIRLKNPLDTDRLLTYGDAFSINTYPFDLDRFHFAYSIIYSEYSQKGILNTYTVPPVTLLALNNLTRYPEVNQTTLLLNDTPDQISLITVDFHQPFYIRILAIILLVMALLSIVTILFIKDTGSVWQIVLVILFSLFGIRSVILPEEYAYGLIDIIILMYYSLLALAVFFRFVIKPLLFRLRGAYTTTYLKTGNQSPLYKNSRVRKINKKRSYIHFKRGID